MSDKTSRKIKQSEYTSFFLTEFITKGAYFVPNRSIAIDYYANFWDKDGSVLFHEVMHRFLYTTMNFGLFLDMLTKMYHKKVISKVSKEATEGSIRLLGRACFNVQEGFASLMGLRRIKEKSGKGAMREKIYRMPLDYKMALGVVEFSIDFSLEAFDKFVTIISRLSMNTGIAKDLSRLDRIFHEENLNRYLSKTSNNPNLRLETLARAVERDKSILDLKPNEICARAGVEYHPSLTTSEKIKMFNNLTKATDKLKRIDEKDFKVPKNNIKNIPNQLFNNISITNLNFNPSKSLKYVKEDINSLISKIDQIRIILIFHQLNPVKNDPRFASYAKDKDTIAMLFLEDGARLGRLVKLEEFRKSPLNNSENITIILSNNCYHNRRTYKGINASMVFYETDDKFKLLLNYLEKKRIKAVYTIMGIEPSNPIVTYFLKTKDDNLIHVVTALPHLSNFIRESKPYKGKLLSSTKDFKSFFSLFKKNHLNNFFHYLMGANTKIDFYELMVHPKDYLSALKRKVGGEQRKCAISRKVGRNEECPCGSGLKYKRCHGRQH